MFVHLSGCAYLAKALQKLVLSMTQEVPTMSLTLTTGAVKGQNSLYKLSCTVYTDIAFNYNYNVSANLLNHLGHISPFNPLANWYRMEFLTLNLMRPYLPLAIHSVQLVGPNGMPTA